MTRPCGTLLAMVTGQLLCGRAAAQVAPATASTSVVLEIKSEGAGYILTRIGGAVLLKGGDVAVLDIGAPALLLFGGRTGRLSKRIGRSGSGPGEYTMPRVLGVPAGTGAAGIWLWDRALSRVTYWNVDGRRDSSRTIRVQGPAIPQADGSILVFPTQAYRPSGRLSRMTMAVVRVRTKAEDTVYSRTVEYPTLSIPNGSGGFIVGAQPFSDEPLVLPSMAGDGFAVVHRGTTDAKGPAWVLELYSGDGRRTLQKSLAYRPLGITDARVEQAVRAIAEPYAGGGVALRSQIRSALVLPTHLPTVTRGLMGADSTIWLRREDTGLRTVRWSRYSTRGEHIRDLDLPSDATVWWSTSDRIIISYPDSDGVPSVRVITID